jgi:hypothetical protein
LPARATMIVSPALARAGPLNQLRQVRFGLGNIVDAGPCSTDQRSILPE